MRLLKTTLFATLLATAATSAMAVPVVTSIDSIADTQAANFVNVVDANKANPTTSQDMLNRSEETPAYIPPNRRPPKRDKYSIGF